ncbi:hypothetical protein MMC13_002845 [Lambiella insularis]|nr:hypothetical protein [Lambiella insularis]
MAATANQRLAASFTPRYMPTSQDGEADEFINYTRQPAAIQTPEKRTHITVSESSSTKPSMQNFHASHAVHHEDGHDSDGVADRLGFSQRFPVIAFAARFTAVMVMIGFPLAIPIIITSRLLASGSNDYSQILVYQFVPLATQLMDCGMRIQFVLESFPIFILVDRVLCEPCTSEILASVWNFDSASNHVGGLDL